MTPEWDSLDLWTQAMVLAYDQIRYIEEMDEKIEMMKAMVPRL